MSDTLDRNDRLSLTEAFATIEELRAEVREWVCESCRTVYPGPPKHGLSCVICPRCGDVACMPMGQHQIRELRAALRACVEALVAMTTAYDKAMAFQKLRSGNMGLWEGEDELGARYRDALAKAKAAGVEP